MSAKRRASPDDAEVVIVTLRIPRALVRALDAEAERRAAERPGLKITRSDVIREALYEVAKKSAKK
jgi:Arc/MetJ-type ribon-helix-helix transcriptional regulator